MRISGYVIVVLSVTVFYSVDRSVHARPVVLILSNDDLNSGGNNPGVGDSFNFEEFGESEPKSEEELDPGSWRHKF